MVPQVPYSGFTPALHDIDKVGGLKKRSRKLQSDSESSDEREEISYKK